MQLSGTHKREIREALEDAFPEETNELPLVVSDAEIGKSWGNITHGIPGYSAGIQALIEYALSDPGRLEGLLDAAMHKCPAHPRLQRALSLVKEQLAAEKKHLVEAQLAHRQMYLDEMTKRFALSNLEDTAAGFAQLLIDRKRCDLPLRVAEAPGVAEGKPLASYLEPGARLLVVAEYPDGLVPLLHAAIVACAEAPELANLEARLPIAYSEHWGVPGSNSWDPHAPNEELDTRIFEDQEIHIASGRAIVFFDRWNTADMTRALEACARHPDNTIVIGARAGAFPASGYKPLYICPLTPGAQAQIAELWLEKADAVSLLNVIAQQPALVDAARSPYLLTVMSIAQRLRIEETGFWTGDPSRAGGARPVPALLMKSLVDAMWERRPLPPRLCGRERVSNELELDRYARQVFQLFRAGIDRVRLDVQEGEPTAAVKATVKTDGFRAIARSTGMFVSATRDGAQVLEPLHPVLWDALAAHGLYVDRTRYTVPRAEELDERWVALFARVADRMTAESKGGKILNSECGNWLWTLYSEKSRALGLATISRSAVVPNVGVHQLLGLRPVPDRWSGYRPDRWRALEAKLRALASLPSYARDPIDVIRVLRRLIPGAPAFDLAIIRLCLSDLQRADARAGRKSPDELAKLLAPACFFELAGRPRLPDVITDWQCVPEDEVWVGASDQDLHAWDNERPLYRVRVPEFHMSASTVTNAQYMKFEPTWQAQQAAETTPIPDGWAELPAVRVSWYEAWIFAEWIGARLPAEIQWERAAWGDRACIRDAVPYWFPTKEQFKSAVWYRENSGGGPHPPGNPPGGGFALPFLMHDMLGNVWEWCEDEQGYEYKEGPVFVYERPHQRCADRRSYLVNRVIRGGSWDSDAEDCRCSARQFAYPAVRSDVIGFRLVRTSRDE